MFLDRQNADGGWSYGTGQSWSEPTCYALLAMAALGLSGSEAARRGSAWLASRQRSDGGWGPRASVGQSTWVTALALLLPGDLSAGVDSGKAASWLLTQSGRESGWANRLRRWMLGVSPETSLQFDGWPWYPDTAAWIAPTALSILALQKIAPSGDPRVRERLGQGRAFLLARRCRDGGWNHGSTRALGYDSGSYPETTGLALLALHDAQGPEVESGVAAAERHLAACRSSEASSWLTLALLARGRSVTAPAIATHGGVIETALQSLTAAAIQGRNLFLGHA